MALVDEAEAAAVAFQAALVRLGATTITEAISLWRRLSATDPEGTAQAWLEDAVLMVTSRRTQSRELGLAYYRLVRALITGTTIPDPRNPEPTYVTLGDLRTAFAELAESALPSDSDDDLYVPVEPRDQPVSERSDPPGEVMERDDTDVAPVDLTDEELEAALRADAEEREREWDEWERQAEEEARVAMEALGPERYKKKRSKGGDSDEAKRKAGLLQASAAGRIVMNGARGEVFANAERDQRALGYVRLSRTGTPCGWCAMLISRGLVLYRDALSAEVARDGDLYHDNCQCYAEPVFAKSQYRESEIYHLNRLYGEQWPIVTDGAGGKVAVGRWRKFVSLTQDMPEGDRIAFWKKWIDSPEGERFDEALHKRWQ
jgi:hypothetical protein